MRIVEHTQIRALRQIRGDDFPRAVGAHAIHKQDFPVVLRIVLPHEAFNATGDVFLLVVNGTNYSKHNKSMIIQIHYLPAFLQKFKRIEVHHAAKRGECHFTKIDFALDVIKVKSDTWETLG